MDLPKEAKRAPSAPVLNQSFPSPVHRIIHRDLQLRCFKRRRAQLLSEAKHVGSPVSLPDKQPYRLQ